MRIRIYFSNFDQIPYHIQIEGPTDRSLELEGQISGQQQVTQQAPENAWDLANLRPTQIVRYLIKVHKLPAGQLSAVSYGTRALSPAIAPKKAAMKIAVSNIYSNPRVSRAIKLYTSPCPK